MKHLMRFVAVLASASAMASAPVVSSSQESQPMKEQPVTPPLAVSRPVTQVAVRSPIREWKLEEGPYQVKCDDLISSCAMPMVRSKAGADAMTIGVLSHSEPGARWAGATVAFKAELRAGLVSGAATLWVRADDANGRTLAFADSAAVALKGSTAFEWRTVSLEIPQATARLRVGIALRGTGAVFIRDVQLTRVSEQPRVVHQESATEGPG